MTLKEELEILRGEPILLKTPVDLVPCNETSDSERLCKHPVVSVHMLTYNHETFIREAIEGVMMQETDFEYELIIGEDASQDKTREICFEYQKKYPDKIRVLWSEENVTRPYGGNGARVTARCRGEFIAFCEGDDYWTDPKKLQKQVDIFRQYPTVVYCFTNTKLKKDKNAPQNAAWWLNPTWDEKDESLWNSCEHLPGLIKGETFYTHRVNIPMTASVMLRKSVLAIARATFEIFNWRLCVGDRQLEVASALLGDIFFLEDITTVYRVHPNGACAQNGTRVARDCNIIEAYFTSYKEGLCSHAFKAALKDLVFYALSQLPSNQCKPSVLHSIYQLSIIQNSNYQKRLWERLFLLLSYLHFNISLQTFLNYYVKIARMIRKIMPQN